jgi:predicted Zn-dependent peptidase
MLAYGRPIAPEELVAKVESVTPAGLQAFAARLASSAPSAVVVGAGHRSRQFAERAGRRIVG